MPSALPHPRRPLRLVAGVLVLGLAAAGCSGSADGSATRARDAATKDEPTDAGATAPVAPLRKRIRADVLVVTATGIKPAEVTRLRKLAPGGITNVRVGALNIGKRRVDAIAVDPSTFRAFAPQGTAESTPVWQAVARGELVVSHDVAKSLKLPLGGNVKVNGGGKTLSLRVGALATTGLPGAGVVISPALADRFGTFDSAGLVLSGGAPIDVTRLAGQVRSVVGKTARIDLLSQPQQPLAFLTGSRAARAFGAFSYRYFEDGTIEPDARWVRNNIVWSRVPILGGVTCHRLMIPQLRAALGEIERAGLGGKIRHRDFGGCYVPRFIEHNPSRSVSLHTWGIAIDLNVATNGVGTSGDIDRRIVASFEKWGFRWGGRWSEPDPMHFELGALLNL